MSKGIVRLHRDTFTVPAGEGTLRRVLARYLPPLTRPVDWTPAVLILLLSLISTLF